MAEFRFHHLERRRLEEALPDLLALLYAEGRRVVVKASSEERVAALNDRLWTYDDASFLPHGAAGDGDPATQPIFLTAGDDNPNRADVVVAVAGAAPPPAEAAPELTILVFDGGDAEVLAEARALWTRLKAEGRAISYWREGEDGGWERAR